MTLLRMYLGQTVTAPGGIGGQCVDWADIAIQHLYGLPPVRANAIDWPSTQLPGLQWIANTPTNYPLAGSLIVWGPT